MLAAIRAIDSRLDLSAYALINLLSSETKAFPQLPYETEKRFLFQRMTSL